MSDHASAGLSLTAFRGLRFTAEPETLGSLLCPPYDIIDAAERRQLIDSNPDNVVRIVLPELDDDSSAVDNHSPVDDHNFADDHSPVDRGAAVSALAQPHHDQYSAAAALLTSWLDAGVVAVDPDPTLYVYEMRTAAGGGVDPDSAGSVTRGLLGAVELRDPADGVILPHENTMAGPVADRLALMEATEANLEPIYLVYDGGGAASELVASVDIEVETAADIAASAAASAAADTESGTAGERRPRFVTSATTSDGTQHRLWAVTDPAVLADVSADLARRHALIADGHHRYATYRKLAERRRPRDGSGPWDRGLALLVDSSAYGPEVHPIHRALPGLGLDEAISRARAHFTVTDPGELEATIARLDDPGDFDAAVFAAVLTDGTRAVVVSAPHEDAVAAALRPGEPTALSELDVWVLHRVLIERTWGVTDNEETVHYAHSTPDALAATGSGVAVLLRATPVTAVAAVAAAGARMPRKSTLFTPKPASGLVMRRFADQDPADA